MKLIEPLFMDSCEINYVPICVTGLTVYIKIVNNQWQLGIIAHLSTYQCYVYVSTWHII